jgi:hypothetical protein
MHEISVRDNILKMTPFLDKYLQNIFLAWLFYISTPNDRKTPKHVMYL